MFVRNKYGVILVSLHDIATRSWSCDACTPISEHQLFSSKYVFNKMYWYINPYEIVMIYIAYYMYIHVLVIYLSRCSSGILNIVNRIQMFAFYTICFTKLSLFVIQACKEDGSLVYYLEYFTPERSFLFLLIVLVLHMAEFVSSSTAHAPYYRRYHTALAIKKYIVTNI